MEPVTHTNTFVLIRACLKELSLESFTWVRSVRVHEIIPASTPNTVNELLYGTPGIFDDRNGPRGLGGTTASSEVLVHAHVAQDK